MDSLQHKRRIDGLSVPLSRVKSSTFNGEMLRKRRRCSEEPQIKCKAVAENSEMAFVQWNALNEAQSSAFRRARLSASVCRFYLFLYVAFANLQNCTIPPPPSSLSSQLLWIYEQIPYDVENISPVATGVVIHKTLHPLEYQLAYSAQRWIVSHWNLLII